MSTTVLSDDTVALVSKLATIQSRKEELQNRIQLYEEKLSMAREANLALCNEEQDLANQLQANGFYYGESPPPQVQTSQPDINASTLPNDFPQNAQDQLAALLSNLFQQQSSSTTSNVHQTNTKPLLPTSGNTSFGNNKGIYNFPQPDTTQSFSRVPTSKLGPVNSPTSGSVIRATPKSSPTSAPGLSIRKHNK